MTDTSKKKIWQVRAAALTWHPLVGPTVIDAIADLGAKIDEQEELLDRTKGIHNVLDVERLGKQTKEIRELRRCIILVYDLARTAFPDVTDILDVIEESGVRRRKSEADVRRDHD